MAVTLSTHLARACTALALFFTLVTGTARAQQTDGEVMLAVGFTPLTVMHSRLEIEDYSTTTQTAWQTAAGGDVLLAVGYGVGAWVLALDAEFSHAVVHEEQRLDSQYSYGMQELTTKRTDVLLGPSVRLLFIEGGVRPFVELGTGVGLAWRYGEDTEEHGTTLYARVGPGLQARLTDDVAFDVTLRAGYAATWGEMQFPLVGIGQSLDGTITYAESTFEYTVQQLSVDLAARLSIWL